ncbi:MAG: hypothetical protein ACJAVF_004463, partial [Paraglaciecola sp.]
AGGGLGGFEGRIWAVSPNSSLKLPLILMSPSQFIKFVSLTLS